MKSRLAAVVALAASVPSAAHAWDDEGHEIVAWFAYQNLTPGARAQAVALLREHPQLDLLKKGCPKGFDEDLYIFMKAATWPDMMRSAANDPGLKEHHRLWHFIDTPFETQGVTASPPVLHWRPGTDPKNIVQALAKCDADLSSPHVEQAEKSKRLCWTLHLVGDIHQPLHAAALFSEQFPQGDHGGNTFGITEDNEPHELHAYWDQLLGASKSIKRVQAHAAALAQRPELKPDRFAAQIEQHSTPAEWAAESFELARDVAYDHGNLRGEPVADSRHLPQDAPALPEGYHAKALALAERQAALAGFRLAAVVNHHFEHPAPAPKPAETP